MVDSKSKVVDKALFYFVNKIKCHILIFPRGFRNGFIVSELIDDTYFWFLDERFPNRKTRLFLCEVKDIFDYEGGENERS